MLIKIQIRDRAYELSPETFRIILNQAKFNLKKLEGDKESCITKTELHVLGVIETLQYQHKELI